MFKKKKESPKPEPTPKPELKIRELTPEELKTTYGAIANCCGR